MKFDYRGTKWNVGDKSMTFVKYIGKYKSSEDLYFELEKEELSLSLCLSTNIRDNEVSTYTQVRWFVGLLDWFEKLSSTPSFPDYRFGIFRNSIKPLPPLSLLLPQIIRNSRNCRVPSGNNTIFSPPFLLSFSEPEEPDHDDERLGGTSEYHATLHLEISLFLRLEYEKKKKKSKNS